MKYCMKCGRQLPDDAAFCCACGCAADGGAASESSRAQSGTQTNAQSGTKLLETLSQREQINGIIWIVIGIVQLVMALWRYTAEGFFGSSVWLLIVAALNIWGGIADLRYSQTVRSDPRGIADRFKPLLRPVCVLIYNLLFGGIIGVAGSLYYFIAIRSFVMENESAFREMDPPTPTDGPYY